MGQSFAPLKTGFRYAHFTRFLALLHFAQDVSVSNQKESKLRNLVKAGIGLLFVFSINLHAGDKPTDFFQRYVELGDAFDPSVANLYSDKAIIHAYRVYPHGLERNMEMTGAQWKQLITKVMPLAKSQNDKSTFSKVEINEFDGGFKIKADRYSVRKCYTDTGYYMVVKPDGNGSLKIFEEYMETKPLPNC